MATDTKPIDDAQKAVLRKLGEEFARIGELPVQKEKAELWRKMNDMEPVRPMVHINEEPWPELRCTEELECTCEHPLLRGIEWSLRSTLYKWNHFPGDMIITPEITCGKRFRSTGIGISQKGATIASDTVTAQHFDAQITCMDDIEKIRMPVITCNEEATARTKAILDDIFDGILPVRLQGIQHIWFTPWDNLIRLVSIENIMMDMVDRPEFVDAMVSRYVDAQMHELDQMEALGLLSGGVNNYRVGSGGYAYTKELPAENDDTRPADCKALWGCGNAQIFSDVSPDMHWEFSLKHELRWLERWGMTYYGCCEPLHMKMGILKKIPNLRKISVSPWFDIPAGREAGADDYVLSVKPNPAIFAEDRFNEDRARQEIRTMLEQGQGCSMELVMKDISTVRNDPERLWRWSDIAMEEAEAF